MHDTKNQLNTFFNRLHDGTAMTYVIIRYIAGHMQLFFFFSLTFVLNSVTSNSAD